MPAPRRPSTSTAWCGSITCAPAPRSATCRSIWSTSHDRDRKSHDIAQGIRPAVEAIARKHGADVKVVEVPPGPPVMSPIVAEIYGPDYDAQIQVAKVVRKVFEQTEGIVAIDDTVEDDAQRFVLRVLQNKAAVAGIAQKDIVAAMKMGLSGENVTPIHGSGAKYEIPVRITLPPERQSQIEELLKLTVRGASGNRVPLSELVEVMPSAREKTIYHKDLLPVVFVVATPAAKIDSPLYGLFSMRGDLKDKPLEQGGTLAETFISQPSDPYAGFSLKWDGEWQVTYETFRDMASPMRSG